ncbi:DUF3613 domain-containing protein [Rhodanobacter sp. DHG33]|uniref:DUF3613 domain-containing protein n=1 Tax=Rhodanobacter sp. DHG33 TaxID=2775921 RepID=UPI00177C09A5|nr:DUF3613 domain-containing protein [Rhodanobacter sp. DHG33]MBD8898945.1 DUF3613 domain-containing protein [Rhodanobacter sp. DHG33]
MNLPIRHTLLVAFGLSLALPAVAQQAPLTGQMMDGQTPAPAPAAAPQPQPPQPVSAAPAPQAPQQVAPPGDDASAEAPPPLADVGDNGGVGSTTRQLLRMQTSGSQAGQSSPMLGDEATAAYRRYMQSFNHPIPEFFQSTVSKNGSGSSGSGY